MLEPEKFIQMIVVAKDLPEPDKLNQDGSVSKVGANGAYLKQLKNDNPDKIVFEPHTYFQVLQYCNILTSLPEFNNLLDLETGLVEYKVEAMHETGIVRTGRIDYAKRGKYLLDLKFAASIKDFDIAKSFAEFEYHMKAAMYLDMWNEQESDNIDTFIFVMLEKNPDKPVARFMRVSDDDIRAGRSMYQQRLISIKNCFDTGKWVSESIETLTLPEWVYNRKTNF